jgi:hypothetical protein
VHKLLVLLVLASASTLARAQAAPTATRRADLQAGGTFSIVYPDYEYGTWKGYGAYADLDLSHHLGVEFDLHDAPGNKPILYERTYEIGPRYTRTIHERYVPYAKALIGRGVFNFAGLNSSGQTVNVANLAYNIYALGGGLDIHVKPYLNVRAFDFEWQNWGSFPPNGLDPRLLSFGVAYHFHGGDRYTQ